ncbi:class I SAM-dependent DNA methyltransferase [Corallococcus sp. CA031C]|uniref:HsdM family class I SAM-dependent methyltransferase n=1 Tax=Corallococcus sp. CA031C TaxID=2316725 RepID=UPI0021027CF8|nr:MULTISPECIES: N-6 DNA methylase [Corallococcus]
MRPGGKFPRALIRAIVDVVQPKPGETIVDPAVSTGGFLLAAHDYIAHGNRLDRDQKKHLKLEVLWWWEIADTPARLCTMNLLLQGIGGDEAPIVVDDAIRGDPGTRWKIVLSNPPFGRKSSVTVINEEASRSKKPSPSCATTCGPPRATNSATSCSTSRRCWR